MVHRDYGHVLYADDEAMIAVDGAVSLTDLNGAVFRPSPDGVAFVALHLSGRIVTSTDGRIIDSGDTLAVVWLASLDQLEDLISAVLNATEDSGAAYRLLTRAWERLDGEARNNR